MHKDLWQMVVFHNIERGKTMPRIPSDSGCNQPMLIYCTNVETPCWKGISNYWKWFQSETNRWFIKNNNVSFKQITVANITVRMIKDGCVKQPTIMIGHCQRITGGYSYSSTLDDVCRFKISTCKTSPNIAETDLSWPCVYNIRLLNMLHMWTSYIHMSYIYHNPYVLIKPLDGHGHPTIGG